MNAIDFVTIRHGPEADQSLSRREDRFSEEKGGPSAAFPV